MECISLRDVSPDMMRNEQGSRGQDLEMGEERLELKGDLLLQVEKRL